MAGDNTSPKVRMLLTIGIVGVCILVAVKFVLESYYLDVTEDYQRALLPKATEIEAIRAADREHLDKGPIPVSVAMQTLATKGRNNASAAIEPQPSDDPSPLIGWAQIQHTGAMPTLTPIPTAPPATPPTDADAGAAVTSTGDAGAPQPKGARDGGAPAAPHHAPAAADGGHG